MTSAELSALCRDRGPEVMETLLEIMRNSESDQCRLKAAAMLWERGYGKATGDAPISDELANLSVQEKIRVLEAALDSERQKLKAEILESLQ